MKNLPVRLFHASLLGLVLGTMLSLGIHFLGTHLHTRNTSNRNLVESSLIKETYPPQPDSTTPKAFLNGPNPDDIDDDGIPNDWENQFMHNPNDISDAGSDFDNDGLTAHQEYQLYLQTGGQSGNPLGVWKQETLNQPDLFPYSNFWPVAINEKGEALVSGEVYEDNFWRSTVLLIVPGGTWHEIKPPDSTPAGYLWANDLNDNGEVVGSRYSMDWSEYESFIWSREQGFRPFTYLGLRADAWKINNSGDWIGQIESPDSQGMRPAFVVDGVNLHNSNDWWPSLWFADINDFGEAMGSWYNMVDYRPTTFLAYGGWRFDTGLLGEQPSFDFDSNTWSWSAAMNAYGEFTGGTSGRRQNQWGYVGYLFDGAFRELSFGELDYISPESLNSSNMIAGYASGNETWGAFIYRDGVGMFIKELLPDVGQSYSSRINDQDQILTTTENGEIIIISPDQDQDGDGIPDDWEDFHYLDKHDFYDAFDDPDGDGINNFGEFLLRSDPNTAPVIGPDGNVIDLRPGIDTDGDGIPNVWEWNHGLDYLDPSDAALDHDRDGFTNLQEYRLNTDPRGKPSFTIHEPGPFSGASHVSLGFSSHLTTDDDGSCRIVFHATPTAGEGGARPASWSPEWGFAFHPSHGNTSSQLLGAAPNGAALSIIYTTPRSFRYWPSPNSPPVELHGGATSPGSGIVAHNIHSLANISFSPSGNCLVAYRYFQNWTGEWILWNMQSAPVPLPVPPGTSISSRLRVNDHGHVVGNGLTGGRSAALFWKLDSTTGTIALTSLPHHPGGNSSTVVGLSNHPSPIVAGTANTLVSGSLRNRATAWHVNTEQTTTSATIVDLGTLNGGTTSSASAISPSGWIAGTANTLVNNILGTKVILAKPNAASSGAPATWSIVPQGEALTSPSILSVNNSGEILGTSRPENSTSTIPTIWRHGKHHPLPHILPASSGYTLQSVISLNHNGSLLASAWKNGALTTLLLKPGQDTDGDGLPDSWENQHHFNPYAANHPSTDSDSDNLPDLDEFLHGTHPRNPDSDSDLMPDGWEVSWGFLPLDPTDAPLDPDGDRVTNLREFQIGTTPTGNHKVETRLTDTSWSHPGITTTDDSGRIVHTGTSHSSDDYELDEDGFFTYQSSQEYLALPARSADTASATTLPGYSEFYRYNEDWSQYTLQYENPQYWSDPVTGEIHGMIDRYLDNYNGTDYEWQQSMFLVPNAAEATDESDWISWDTIVEHLKNPDLHNGNPALDSSSWLEPYPTAVSSRGTRRIHTDYEYGRSLVLNERGEFISELPASVQWRAINNHGETVALRSKTIPAANGAPAYTAQEIHHATVTGASSATTIPHTPGDSATFSIHSFSDDRKVLLSRSVRNAQFVSATHYFMFDLKSGSLSRVRQPGIGYERIQHFSTTTGRLVGRGTHPFQVTPDGTCIRLAALRIKESPSAPAVPLASLHPRPLQPHHISPDGTITLTTTNASYQTIFLQILPHNDANQNGLPDDWETSEIQHLIAQDPAQWSHLAAIGSLDPDTDYWGDGYTANQSLFLNLTTPDRLLGADRDSDGDHLSDDSDADPLDKAVDWRRKPEPRWFLVDLDTPAENMFVSDVSLNGTVLLQKVKGGSFDHEILIDRNRQKHMVPLAPINHLEMEHGELYAHAATRLIGERMLGLVFIDSEQGIEYVLWDHTASTGINYAIYELDCYPDEILDSPDVFQVRQTQGWANGLEFWTPFGYLPSSVNTTWDVRIEKEGNIVSRLVSGEILYWIFNRRENTYSSPITIYQSLDESYSDIPLSSTIKEEKMSFDLFDQHHNWHCVTSSVVHVSREGGAFHRTKIGLGLTASFVGAGPGWFMADTNQNSQSTMIWCNGFWKDLRDLSGKLTGDKMESLRVLKMRDNGVGIAEVKMPDQPPTLKLMIPAEVVEVSPKLVDEMDREIPASEIPNPLPKSTAMVERDPTPTVESNRILDASTQRIAWRELKVKVGDVFANKTATWTMTPQFTPHIEVGSATNIGEMITVPDGGGPRFRGSWAHATNPQHRHRFSVSQEYDTYDFAPAALNPANPPINGETTVKATTQIDSEGYTAIRVNVPPIGLNKARITLEVEGTQLDILDLEVPAVIVIDPGHGGADSGAVGSDGTTYEKDLALSYGLDLQAELRDQLDDLAPFHKVLMTRSTDVFIDLAPRPAIARDAGADVFASIHFNSGSATARGTETFVERLASEASPGNPGGNHNIDEDETLATPVNTETFAAVAAFDQNADNRGVKRGGKLVTRDAFNGNVANYHPLRTCLIEIEFISNADALASVTGANGDAIQTAFAEAVGKALVNDIQGQAN